MGNVVLTWCRARSVKCTASALIKVSTWKATFNTYSVFYFWDGPMFSDQITHKNNPTKRINVPVTSSPTDFSYARKSNSSKQCFQDIILSTIQHMETHNFDLYMFSCWNFNFINSQVNNVSFISMHFLNTLAIPSYFTECKCISTNPYFLPKQMNSHHFYDNIFIALIVARKA